jgi:hypothetical protein
MDLTYLHAMKKAADAHGLVRMDVNYWVKKWTTDGSAANFQAAARVLEAAAQKQRKHKKKGKEKAAEPLKEGDKGYRAAYSAAYKEGGHLARAKQSSQRKIATQMREKHNLATFSQKTVGRAMKTIDSSPAKSGPSQRCPLAAEKMLVGFILELRLLKLPTHAHSICNYAARLIKGTEWEDDFLSADKEIIEIPIHWFFRFIASSQAEPLDLSKNARALEQVRHAWATAEHMKAHYDVVMKVLLKYGIAKINPAYDEAVPHSLPIIMNKEQEYRVLSFDETHWTADMTETCRASQIKCEGDSMDVVFSKSSKTAALIGGSKMNGFAPCYCVLSLLASKLMLHGYMTHH